MRDRIRDIINDCIEKSGSKDEFPPVTVIVVEAAAKLIAEELTETSMETKPKIDKTVVDNNLLIWEGEGDNLGIKILRTKAGSPWELRLDHKSGQRLYEGELESEEFEAARAEGFLVARHYIRSIYKELAGIEQAGDEEDFDNTP